MIVIMEIYRNIQAIWEIVFCHTFLASHLKLFIVGFTALESETLRLKLPRLTSRSLRPVAPCMCQPGSWGSYHGQSLATETYRFHERGVTGFLSVSCYSCYTSKMWPVDICGTIFFRHLFLTWIPSVSSRTSAFAHRKTPSFSVLCLYLVDHPT